MTPRTLCEETCSKGCSLTHKGPRSGRVLSELITSSLHFFGLRFILSCDDHWAMTSRSYWRDDVPPGGMTSYIVRSSTYFQWLDSSGVSDARSLIIRRNRIGPSLVPCGTPAFTGIQGDTMFLILTAWRWSQRKLQIHRIMKPWTPRWMSLLTKILWSIWSKALLKSRKQALRNIPGLSMEDNQLCIMSNRQKVVEVPLRQPNWLGSMMCSTSSISHSTTKSSKTLETIAVREIGLKSPLPVMP